MKYILAILFVFSIAIPAQAERYCQWNDVKGINCTSTNSVGVLKTTDGALVSGGEANINTYLYYKLTDTQPSVLEGSVRDAEIWDKVDNQISRTWSVREKTQLELDQENCAGMQNTMWLAKKLVTKGTLVAGDFTASETTIYQACQALEE